MILYTLDEARLALVASARSLVSRCESDDSFVVAAVLWGAGDVDDALSATDRRRARRHRRLLDELIDAGYGGDVVDELDGISSALGLPDGELNRHAL